MLRKMLGDRSVTAVVSISSNFIKNKSLGLMISAEGYEVFFKQNQTVFPFYFKNVLSEENEHEQ